jgi:hypothetical protein
MTPSALPKLPYNVNDSIAGEERENIPYAFRTFASHKNHIHLSYINGLARQAGIKHDFHKNVQMLQPDTGEVALFGVLLPTTQMERGHFSASNQHVLSV